MKKFKVIIVVFLGLFATLGLKAQTKDYYVGKWDFVIYKTPYGDVKRIFVLERKDGKLAGIVQDSTGQELTKITNVTEKEKTVAIDFTSQGYDVTLTLEPVDSEHARGNLAGFEAKGARRKEGQ